MKVLLKVTLLAGVCITQIAAHGMMLDPPSRSSRWREDATAPINYNDNELFCGGLYVQTANDGKCGLCGDNYAQRKPRDNEIGGRIGVAGVVTRSYWHTNVLTVTVLITANHLGYFIFDLCNLDASAGWGDESEKCFAQHSLKFVDGNDRLYIGTKGGQFEVTAFLPNGISCQHCVLRWTYVTGNNWGRCENGTRMLGCGPQETFRNCADISVVRGNNLLHPLQSTSVNVPVIPVELEDVHWAYFFPR